MKKRTLRRFASALLALTLALSLAACGKREQTLPPPEEDPAAPEPEPEAPPEEPERDESVYLIGISSSGRLDYLNVCREGFLQGLEAGGLQEGVDFQLDERDAGFEAETAAQIARDFAGIGVDLMAAFGDLSAAACAENAGTVPVLFAASPDPEADGAAGISDTLAVEGQLNLIRQLQPHARTIGILYVLGDDDSVRAVGEYEKTAGDYGFTLDTIGVTDRSDLANATDVLVTREVDCIANLLDRTVLSALPTVLAKASEAGIPVYGSEAEQVKAGCAAGAGIDYEKLGIRVGLMAAKVLTGKTAFSDVQSEIIANYESYVNGRVLQALNIELPANVAAQAADVAKATSVVQPEPPKETTDSYQATVVNQSEPSGET